MSLKENLTGEQFVKRNLKEALQVYKIFYYPPEANYPTDKIWLYFNRKEKEKYFGIKSLCFSSPENHKNFILNNIYAHIYQLTKRAEEHIPDIEIFRYKMALLNRLLMEIRKKIPERWQEKIKVRV